MPLRQTHTYTVLEISPAAYKEIAGKLKAAGYGHCFSLKNDEIDMAGIALAKEPEPDLYRIVSRAELPESMRGAMSHVKAHGLCCDWNQRHSSSDVATLVKSAEEVERGGI